MPALIHPATPPDPPSPEPPPGTPEADPPPLEKGECSFELFLHREIVKIIGNALCPRWDEESQRLGFEDTF